MQMHVIKKLMMSVMVFGMLGMHLTVGADEGMWQPHQLPELKKKLKKAGLKIPVKRLASLKGFPMDAIVSLGGCTASFVSDKGLVVTNHHCAYGSIQYNSSEDNNILQKGFLAQSLNEELQASPGSRVYVTEDIAEVTKNMTQGLHDSMSGKQRYDHLEQQEKKLVAQCESDSDYRCRVVSFHGGLEYFLFKQLMIRDVRLVHAPASSIGKYGGDIDNWIWPRHTGDYAFYRAYVSKDGKPADYHEDNVPYQPKHFLKVNASGVKDKDFVMAIGYPGSTNRYRTAKEINNQFTWTYPVAKQYREEFIDIIHQLSKPGSERRIKYESTLAGLANYAKNYGSMIKSYQKSDFLQRRIKLEQELVTWISKKSSRQNQYGQSVKKLNQLIDENLKNKERSMVLSYMGRTQIIRTAYRLHRLAIEKQKSDLERESGYQERDMPFMKQSLEAIDKRYVSDIDKAALLHFLNHYRKLPKHQRLHSLDAFLGIDKGISQEGLRKKLDTMYAKTQLGEKNKRLSWMEQSLNEFNNSDDPFIQLAVATYNERDAIEKHSKQLAGELNRYRPKYMQALIAFYKDQGKPIYADANSTLRVTYGNVKGYSPRDGLYSTPFTRLEGILEKDTGKKPFDSPKKQLDLIRSKRFGDYEMKSLDSVPVNFLSTVDITGGNSGSPTLNAKAEFIGLLFDGVYESVIGDWDYNPQLNRSISVDVRYMLWVMENIYGAHNLMEEMHIIR